MIKTSHRARYRHTRTLQHHYVPSNNTIAQRAQNIKAILSPVLFYLDELPGLELRRESGWHDGGLCPFHEDRHAGSFKINLDSGAFKCFACGVAGGDIIAFYRLRYCTDFMTALSDLEGRAGIWRR